MQCDQCFLNKESVLVCLATGMLDSDNGMKGDKWGTVDYTQRNMFAPPAERQNNPGVPFQYAPKAPQFKKNLG